MYGAADLLKIMDGRAEGQQTPTIQLATMTAFNTLMIGGDLELTEEQCYFFERDTYRQCRTHRPPKKVVFEEPVEIRDGMVISEIALKSNEEVKDNDHSVYVKPYEEGDLVAVICIGSGQYLVLGKVLTGAEVKELEERVDLDWELEGNYDEPTT